MSSITTPHALDALYADRAIAVVRVPVIPDPVELCRALAAGGIRSVEFTFTTPGVEALIREAADACADHGAVIGAGTVVDDQHGRLGRLGAQAADELDQSEVRLVGGDQDQHRPHPT